MLLWNLLKKLLHYLPKITLHSFGILSLIMMPSNRVMGTRQSHLQFQLICFQTCSKNLVHYQFQYPSQHWMILHWANYLNIYANVCLKCHSNRKRFWISTSFHASLCTSLQVIFTSPSQNSYHWIIMQTNLVHYNQ